MKKILLLASVVIGFMSCSNDDVLIEKTNETTNQTKSFTLITKYKDLTYEVPCTLENDSLIYLNQEFNDLYQNEIALIENLAMLTYKDGIGQTVVEYYQSAEELETKSGMIHYETQNTSNTKADSRYNPLTGRAILYDDTNFKDRTTVIDIFHYSHKEIPHLKPYNNFNDKTSAIRVFNFLEPNEYYRPPLVFDPLQEIPGKYLRTCLSGYEHDNNRVRVLYCIATYSESANINNPSTATHNDWKLKEIGWNDKITSVKFSVVKVSDINNGIYTPH